MIFENRNQAGFLLVKKLRNYKGVKDVVVLGIPRGGIIVAGVVSRILNLQMGILITKKIGAPNQEELAIGSIGPDGSVILDHKLVQELGVSSEYIEMKAQEKSDEIIDKYLKYKALANRKLEGKKIILVDDGIATGATVEVAIKYLRMKKVRKIILAVPVAPKSSLLKFQKLADKFVVVYAPLVFHAVGQFYKEFPQVTDEEVAKILKEQIV